MISILDIKKFRDESVFTPCPPGQRIADIHEQAIESNFARVLLQKQQKYPQREYQLAPLHHYRVTNTHFKSIEDRRQILVELHINDSSNDLGNASHRTGLGSQACMEVCSRCSRKS